MQNRLRIGKVFENVIFSNIYFSIKRTLCEKQHGFVKGRSTVTNLFLLTQFLAKSVDDGVQADVIYADFSKAFDRINHKLLLQKLSILGFSPFLLNLIASYLCDRKQFVLVAGHSSREIFPTSGVPQGSVLGPLLFGLFINDIIKDLDVEYLLYADDLKLFSKIEGWGDCHNMQLNLSKILDWCDSNQLPVNKEKCYVMSFSLKQKLFIYDYKIESEVLSRPIMIHDLGVIFDSKLTFRFHIEHVISECFKTLGYIYRNTKEFTESKTLMSLYTALVRPKIDYACVIWFPYHATWISQLERIQRKFLKYLCYKEDGVYPQIGFPHSELLQRFSVTTTYNRNKMFSAMFIHKIVTNDIDCSDIIVKIPINANHRMLSLRNQVIFALPTPRTNVLKYSPLYRMCYIGNWVNRELGIFDKKKLEIKKLDYNES